MKIFLSGGYSNLSREEATEWRKLIKSIAIKEYPLLFLEFIDPTELYIPPETYNPSYEKEAMQYDLYHVKTSDIVIVHFNSLTSIGTAQEIMYAHTLNKPIIGLISLNEISKLHPWYKEECMKIFLYNPLENKPDSLNKALKEVIKYCWERFE